MGDERRVDAHPKVSSAARFALACNQVFDVGTPQLGWRVDDQKQTLLSAGVLGTPIAG